MIQLRDYQLRGVEAIRAEYRARRRRVLYVAPTGSGKTVLFSYITHGAMAFKHRVMILAHRIELIDQIDAALNEFTVPHSFVAAGYPCNAFAKVLVCSVQTLIRRMHQIPAPDLLILDEAHHCTLKNTYGKILAFYSNARALGVTATPTRLSGEGLGDVFDSLVLGPPVQELIDCGSLSPVSIFAPPTMDTSQLKRRMGEFVTSDVLALADKPSITGDAVAHYRKHADGKRAVAFCVSVEHARHVAASFAQAGYSSMHIDGGMERHSRRDAVDRFRDGRINVLSSCDLISEGFDLPAIECGIFLRPTASLGLWLQQAGRCLRTFPDKSRAILLDHAGNTLRHGMPQETRQWTLQGTEKASAKGEKAISVRVCPQCFSAGKSARPVCANCGYTFPIDSRKVVEREGELEEITAPQSRASLEQDMAKSLEALIALGRMRGYKDPGSWARHVYHGRLRAAARKKAMR